MPLRWSLTVALSVLFALGCAGPPPAPSLQPGDVVRPEVSFAPLAPWPEGAKVAIGVLLRVERPNCAPHYLKDEDVNVEQAVVQARVTFLDGDRSLGDPLEVPFVHDC